MEARCASITCMIRHYVGDLSITHIMLPEKVERYGYGTRPRFCAYSLVWLVRRQHGVEQDFLRAGSPGLCCVLGLVLSGQGGLA